MHLHLHGLQICVVLVWCTYMRRLVHIHTRLIQIYIYKYTYTDMAGHTKLSAPLRGQD